MPKVTQEHLDRRRREILDGARRCFARYGYEGATVRRLEREIGLSRGAIFNYFPDKWELFFALALEEYERSPDSWANGGFEELARSLVEEDPSWISVHFEFARRLRTQPALRSEVLRRLSPGRDRVLASVEEAQRKGEFRADVPPETIRAFLALLLDGVALSVSTGGQVDIDAILKLVDDAVRPRGMRPVPRRDVTRVRAAS
jgi:AcrR family transcriptional regulator